MATDSAGAPEGVTICHRVETAAVALEGHEHRDCAECGEAVVVNPATLTSIEEGVYPETIVCLTCVEEGTDE